MSVTPSMQYGTVASYLTCIVLFWTGMNAAVRAIVRMGLHVGCKVYLIKEVGVMSFVYSSF